MSNSDLSRLLALLLVAAVGTALIFYCLPLLGGPRFDYCPLLGFIIGVQLVWPSRCASTKEGEK